MSSGSPAPQSAPKKAACARWAAGPRCREAAEPILDCATRVATRSSKGQIVQFQRRQSLSIGQRRSRGGRQRRRWVGFGASHLDGLQLGTQRCADDLSFRHGLPSHRSWACIRRIRTLPKQRARPQSGRQIPFNPIGSRFRLTAESRERRA